MPPPNLDEERKAAESDALKSAGWLRIALESAGVGTWEWDVAANHLRCSDIADGLFGLQAAETIGSYEEFAARVHPDDRDRVSRAVADALHTESDYHQTYRVIWPNGSIRWLDARGRVYRDTTERPVRMAGTLMEITQQKESEEAIHRAELRLRAVVEDQTEMIVRWKPDGTRTFVNQAYCRAFGKTEPELVGTSFFPLIAESHRQQVIERLHRLSPEFPVSTGIHESILPNGTTCWQEWTDRALFDSDGRLIELQSVGRDVSERRRLEEQIRQTQKMDAIGQLAGGVAHDFNNMLAVILMQADLLSTCPGLPLAAAEHIDGIKAASERASNLTRQLLTFSSQNVIQPRLLDVSVSVTATLRMLQRILGEQIEIQVDLSPVPLFVRADPGMFDQVLMNLTINARDAMPRGGKLTIATTQRELSQTDVTLKSGIASGRYVSLSVSDNGTGIPPENLTRIFEPFFTTKESGKGTGLGLATVFGIVKQHHGAVEVQSEFGKGTVFHVLLPVSDSPGIDTEREAMECSHRGGNERILVVEDDPVVRQLTRVVLERNGYRVREAASGPEAVQIWNEQSGAFDLLVTDIVMPDGMNGHELAANFLARHPGLKVIVATGYSAGLAGREWDTSTPQRFLPKPFLPADLLVAVRECLDQ